MYGCNTSHHSIVETGRECPEIKIRLDECNV